MDINVPAGTTSGGEKGGLTMSADGSYIPRYIDRALDLLLAELPALMLTGPRGRGKTTIAARDQSSACSTRVVQSACGGGAVGLSVASTSPKHGLTSDIADEAWLDPNRLTIDPDPASMSGRTIRVIGWSPTSAKLVTVIVLPDGDTIWGVNAWPSNSTDRRRYLQEPNDDDQ